MSCQSCQSCQSCRSCEKPITFGLNGADYYKKDSFIGRLADNIDKSPDTQRVNTGVTHELLENYARCDAIIVYVPIVSTFSSRYQKALDVVEKPVYMCYEGDVKIANKHLAEAMIGDHRKLRVNGDADAEDVIAAICKHIENPCDRSVQQIYDDFAKDRRITLWIGQRGEVISSLAPPTPPVYATVSGTHARVDKFVKALADKLALPVQNKACSNACYNTERFLACFIEMKQDHGFDVEDDLQLLMDIVIGRLFLFQTVNHHCTIDLSQRT